jgi:non-specific serine/threonine protein kinase
MLRALAALTAALALVAPGAAAEGWRTAAPMPAPRSEVAAATFRGGVAVVTGFAPGVVSTRVDLYLPGVNRWRRLPDVPIASNHASAAAAGGKLYVVGGYGARAQLLRAAFVLEGKRWRRLKPMPGPRAAAAAAVLDGKLYVFGGLAPTGLAESGLALDLRTERWTKVPGPMPREHLAAVAAEGRLWATGGRLGGVDANVGVHESWAPGESGWTGHAVLPEARGGAGLAYAAGQLVSVGGEGPNATTLARVFGYSLAEGRWRELTRMKTPRHGLAVAAIGNRVYAIGGSPIADLGYSGANELLDLTP